jgi:hypothetical protein
VKIRRILGAALVAAAAVTGTATSAWASPGIPVHKPFVVIVNGGVDVTLAHLTVGQVVYKAGVAETVVSVNGHAVRFVPAVTGANGKVYQFST